MPQPGRYSAAKAAADTRHAIIRKIRSKKDPSLDWLVAWIGNMDERALGRKGGVTRPRYPLKKIPGTGIKKVK